MINDHQSATITLLRLIRWSITTIVRFLLVLGRQLTCSWPWLRSSEPVRKSATPKPLDHTLSQVPKRQPSPGPRPRPRCEARGGQVRNCKKTKFYMEMKSSGEREQAKRKHSGQWAHFRVPKPVIFLAASSGLRAAASGCL